MESEILQDNYEHEDDNIFYTPVNIPGPGVDADVTFFEQFEGCACSGLCVGADTDCGCVRGRMPFYYQGGILTDVDHPPDLIYECHVNCQCETECTNRLVQRGPHPHLQLMNAGPKGMGLRSKVDLPKGTFVCEYAGEVIGTEEARRRYGLQQGLGRPNYIFALREHFGESCQVLTYIDPTFIGNIGRYVNHSCDPNLVIVPVRTDIVVPKLCLFARRDIPAHTELSFDYGGGLEPIQGVPDGWSGAKDCHCMADSCRRVLPFDYSLG